MLLLQTISSDTRIRRQLVPGSFMLLLLLLLISPLMVLKVLLLLLGLLLSYSLHAEILISGIGA